MKRQYTDKEIQQNMNDALFKVWIYKWVKMPTKWARRLIARKCMEELTI